MDLRFKSSLLITEGDKICDTLLCDILPLVVVVVVVAGGQRVGVCCNLQRFWKRLLLIVKLAWTGWSTAVVFPPHVEVVSTLILVSPVRVIVFISAAYCCWLNLSSKFIAGWEAVGVVYLLPLCPP